MSAAVLTDGTRVHHNTDAAETLYDWLILLSKRQIVFYEDRMGEPGYCNPLIKQIVNPLQFFSASMSDMGLVCVSYVCRARNLWFEDVGIRERLFGRWLMVSVFYDIRDLYLEFPAGLVAKKEPLVQIEPLTEKEVDARVKNRDADIAGRYKIDKENFYICAENIRE